MMTKLGVWAVRRDWPDAGAAGGSFDWEGSPLPGGRELRAGRLMVREHFLEATVGGRAVEGPRVVGLGRGCSPTA